VTSPPDTAPVEPDSAVPELAAAVLVSAVSVAAQVEAIRRMYATAGLMALQALRVAASAVLRVGGGDVFATFDVAQRLDRTTRAVATRLERQSRRATLALVATAQREGVRDADRDLGQPDTPDVPDPLDTDLRASEAQTAHQAITQRVHNVFRDVVSAAMANEGNRPNRKRAVQAVLDRFAERGISVFQDKAGREWSIDAYAEMAVRTAAAQARLDAYVNRARAAGVTKLRVSISPTCCGICAPYDGQIVAIDSPLPPYHPNCKHTVTAFRTGDKVPPAPRPDMERYQAQQRLRYLERRVRAAKRRLAVALDDQTKRKANAEMRAAFAAIRAHTDQTGIARQRNREQINRAR
jgi:hypothetical protein